jgi:membrane-bound serine protease (ClpP class)
VAPVLAVLVTLVDEIVLAAFLLWLLPQLGIKLPLGFTIGILAVLAVSSALIYRPIKRAMKKKATTGVQTMVGKRGTAVTKLATKGLVEIEGETWGALSSNKEVIEIGDNVTVLEVSGLKLTVRKGWDIGPKSKGQ